MFRVDIPDNALKTKVSSKYENSQKKPRWMEQLNKSEAPRVAAVQCCKHDCWIMDLPQKHGNDLW